MNIDEYIARHIDAEPAQLAALERRVNLQLLYPRMCSGHVQGRILRMLTAMIAPHRILEVGTYAGYSALCMAEALAPDGELHTIEINDESEDFIRREFEASPYSDRLHLHIGDACEVLPQFEAESFDMAFIDANKRTYIATYEQVLPLVRHGGFILADNTLWSGKVVDDDERVAEDGHHHDAQTQGIIDFNNHVATDTRVERVILPLRDGLTIIRVK